MTDEPTYVQRTVLRLVAELGGSAPGPAIHDAAERTVGPHLITLRDAGYLRSRPRLNGDGRAHRWELTADGRAVVERQAEAGETAVAELEGSE